MVVTSTPGAASTSLRSRPAIAAASATAGSSSAVRPPMSCPASLTPGSTRSSRRASSKPVHSIAATASPPAAIVTASAAASQVPRPRLRTRGDGAACGAAAGAIASASPMSMSISVDPGASTIDGASSRRIRCWDTRRTGLASRAASLLMAAWRHGERRKSKNQRNLGNPGPLAASFRVMTAPMAGSPLPTGYGPGRRRIAPAQKLGIAVVIANLGGLIAAVYCAQQIRAVPAEASTETILFAVYYTALCVAAVVDALLIDELVFHGAFRLQHLAGKDGSRLNLKDDEAVVAASMQRSLGQLPGGPDPVRRR